MTHPIIQPSFHDSMETVHQLLRGDLSPGEAAQKLGAPENRIGIYQQFIRGHIDNILEKNFSALKQIIPSDTWSTITTRYFKEFPAQHFELNENAADFPDYLAKIVDSREFNLTAFHVELAQLEWVEFEAYASEIDIPWTSEILRPTLNPTLTILQFDYPTATALDHIRSLDDNESFEVPAASAAPNVTFVYRNPKTHEAMILKADDNILFAFKIVHDEISVEEAAATAGINISVAETLLKQAAETGLILLPNLPGTGK